MNFIDKMVERFIKLNRRMKRWQRVVSVMAAVVVFATTYALILPAITLDTDTATTQAGIEVVASENEPDEAGTVFESVEEELIEEKEPVTEVEEESVTEVEENLEEAAAEENSSSESGSQEAEETEAAAENNADESEQTEVLTTEEAVTYSTTEEAIAAATGKTAEEVKLITEDTQLTFAGNDYVVYADFGASAKLPEGVQLQAREITKESDPEAYEMYYERALSEMQGKYDDVTELSFAKFYDISFMYEGIEIEPSGNVNVRIEYKKAEEIIADANVETIHFDKKNDEAPEIISSDVDVNNDEINAVEFTSDQFSVYAVVAAGDDGDYARMNLHFMNGENEVAMMIVKNGDTTVELNTIIYDPGVGDIAEGTIFKGWTTSKTYTVDDADNGMDIDEVRTWAAARPITENEDVYLYAMLYKNYVINYLDENNAGIGSENIFMTLDGSDETPYTVNMAYTPKDDTHAFQGWYVAEGKDNIVDYTEGKLYQNGDEITISGSVTFTVNAPEGHWLVFNENGKGATYNAPVFVESGTTPKDDEPDPEKMVRLGYSFGGWYTDAACTAGSEFDFNSELSDRTEIFAKWTPISTAPYTVIIWRQNINADGYDFEESISLTGNVGSNVSTVTQQGTGNSAYARINGSSYQYTGFHLKEFDQNVRIVPEGNAVVNVYYDRTEYTLTFQDYINRRWTTVKEIKALYEQNISSNFPIVGTNGRTYNNGERWDPQSSTPYSEVLVYIDVMPAANVTFHLDEASRPLKTMNWYVEALPGASGTVAAPNTLYEVTANGRVSANGKRFVLYNTISARYNGVTPDEDFIDIDGFTKIGADSAWVTRNGTKFYIYNEYQNGTVNFYYSRDTYRINYLDGIYVDGNNNPVDETKQAAGWGTSEEILYQADISSYNEGGNDYYIPSKQNYVFEGWYLDDACTQPYTFTTMPKDGVTVYAKWRQVQYRVFLHPDADDDESLDWGSDSQEMNFRVSLGEPVSTPTGRRSEYEFVGWYTDEAKTPASLYNSDTRLYDSVVTTPYNQEEDYTDPMDKWGNIGENPSNSDKKNNRFWITKKLDLYAKWRLKLLGATGIGVAYELTDSEGHTGTGSVVDTIKYLDEAEATAQVAPTAPSGYKFVKWHVQEWNGTEYVDTGIEVYPGDSFFVYKNDAKVLVTEWAKSDDPDAEYITIENPEPGTTPPNPEYPRIRKATYTIQLQAEYVKEGTGTPTHINWYGNNETAKTAGNDFVQVNDNIKINEAVPVKPSDTFTYEGHKFLGWARLDNTDSILDNELDGKSKELGENDLFLKWIEDESEEGGGHFVATSNTVGASNGSTVSYVAVDERTPYHAMVAVWEVKPYTVTIVKEMDAESVDKDTDKYKAFQFSAAFGTESAQSFVLNGVTESAEGSEYVNTKSFENINYGTKFSISETADDYDVTIVAECLRDGKTSSEAITPGEDGKYTVYGDTTITFTNKRKTGALQIGKVTNPEGVSNSKAFKVSVKNSEGKFLQDTGTISFGDEEKKFDVSVNNALTINNLPIGQYTLAEDISEAAIEGYRFNGVTYTGGSAVVQVVKDATVEMVMTNSYTKLANVAVTKTLVDEIADGSESFTFKATLTENGQDITGEYLGTPAEGETGYEFTLVPGAQKTVTRTFENIPVGAVLAIEETGSIDHTTTVSINGGDATETLSGNLTVADSETNSVVFTNTRKAFTVDFKKTGTDGTTELNGAKFTLTRSNGTRYIAYPGGDITIGTTNMNLAAGDYELTEISAPDGYVVLSNKIRFTVASDGTLSDPTNEEGSADSKLAVKETGISEGSKGTIVVKNTPGEQLPNAGGPGTLLYTLSGLVLILASALMYGFRMRRGERRFK